MNFDAETEQYSRIFQPELIEIYSEIAVQNKRFVYYTSADTAMKIIRNKELWFRNALVMNDFSEISYGLHLISRFFSGEEGKRFRETVEDIFEGTIEKVNELFLAWEADWRLETYLACVSVHESKEDQRGRLSMWRAYGDTALVVNNHPMMSVTDLLGVYSVPVLYLSEGDLTNYLAQITNQMLIHRRYLLNNGQEKLVTYIHHMLFRIAIATKHPGFEEEKEWRLFYRPTERKSPAMEEEIVVLSGTPQKIFKLRLADEPENGLFGADISSLVDRVIIGPCEFPFVSQAAFAAVLGDAGVEDAAKKVIVSDIPLRIR
jgi:hypothetical protein